MQYIYRYQSLEVSMQNLLNDLRSFRLSGIINSLNKRIIYAQNNKLGFKEFLSLLCEDEKSNRKDNKLLARSSKRFGN